MIKHVHDTLSYGYATDILEDKIVVCNFIKQSAKRFLSDIKRDDVFLDLEKVEMVHNFFGKVVYVPELKKAVPLQPPRAFHLEQLFGFYFTDTGLRRFTEVYYQVARKNLKTFDAAGIGICEGLLGRDNYPEIMVAANSRDQAIICTNKMGAIVKASPELKELYEAEQITLHTYKKLTHTITYEDEDRLCRIEAMPKDPGDGGNPSVSITDELHEAKSLDHLETAESGQGQRLEPMNVVITSPGHNKNGPCFSVLRKKSIEVVNGSIENDNHLSLIYELDSKDECYQIDMLEKSNPMMPYIPTIKPFLLKRIKKAKDEGGAIAANIMIKNCGLWIDAPKIWIGSDIISKNNYGLTVDHLEGKKCYAGLDLSAGKDLNALVYRFEEFEFKGKMIKPVLARFYIPEEKVINQKDDQVDYRKFVEDGWITLFPGNVNEYDKIALDMISDHEKFDVQSYGCDPKYLYTGVTSHLKDNPEVAEKIMPVAQGFNSLTGPTEMIEQYTAKFEMDFIGNPVMEMCFSNTTIHTKDSVNESGGGISGHKFPAKGKSHGRIDGVIGLVNAEHEYLRLQSEPVKEPVVSGIDITGFL